ncbi:NUDIX domain-containing protein 1 [Elsinoe fawcettii]|nr:NUDIX domain-containing protein 1 [Elsinoe fawcettii]
MAKDAERSMEARVGRDNQRYGSQGERLVAGIVPLSSDHKLVLLIQSTRHNGWVLPKGGWETDEPTQEEAAKREAWEEAGVVVKVQRDLGKITERRSPDQYTNEAPKATYNFFEATVEEEKAKWPEMHKRRRKWMTYKEAIGLLKERPELLEALERSSLDKSR